MKSLNLYKYVKYFSSKFGLVPNAWPFTTQSTVFDSSIWRRRRLTQISLSFSIGLHWFDVFPNLLALQSHYQMRWIYSGIFMVTSNWFYQFDDYYFERTVVEHNELWTNQKKTKIEKKQKRQIQANTWDRYWRKKKSNSFERAQSIHRSTLFVNWNT